MALINILSELAADFGLNLSQADDRAYLVDKVNKTAKFIIYDAQDLQGCQREQIFEFGATDQQVVLPWYVEKPLLARNYDTLVPIQMQDFQPRYQTQLWLPPYFTWRIKQKQALKHSLGDVGPITVTFAAPLDTALTVYITMRTAAAQRVTEALVFAVGDTTKTTTNLAEDVAEIKKSDYGNADLVVTDLNAVEIADIPNNRLTAEYTLLQVMDRGQTNSQSQLLEILYKLVYIPMVEDNDVFTAGEGYDRAIYYETKSQILLKQDNQLPAAKIAHDFYKGLASSFSVVQKNEIDPTIVVEPNPYLGLIPRVPPGPLAWRWGRYAGPGYSQ